MERKISLHLGENQTGFKAVRVLVEGCNLCVDFLSMKNGGTGFFYAMESIHSNVMSFNKKPCFTIIGVTSDPGR